MRIRITPLVAIAVMFLLLPLRASAADTPGDLLTVSGKGIVQRAPDRATLELQIQTTDADAKQATARNNALYATLRSHLAALHIPEDNIVTRTETSYNSRSKASATKPQLEIGLPVPSDGSAPPYGFTVARAVEVELPSLEGAGAAIDAAISAGVNNITGVSYGLRDRSDASAAALAAAWQDALAKATVLARAADMRIVRVHSINAEPSPYIELFEEVSDFGEREASMFRPHDNVAPPPAITVKGTVTVTFEITPR